jgi:K+/H+ antiporter YhaU regulatory subunit KhtT
MRLRSETGALVVGVRRGDKLLEELDPTDSFEPGDVVFFVGTSEALTLALALFDPVRSVEPTGSPPPVASD